MAIRSNHYDVACEELLRELRRPYVAVDERRRALAAEASLKSFDFVVYSPRGQNLLVDVKGRKFPTAASHLWENWAGREDVEGLLRWEQIFGKSFRGLLLFTYELTRSGWEQQHRLIWQWRGRRYAFYGVWADEYAAAMKPRSARWETVCLPAAEFRELRRDVLDLL